MTETAPSPRTRRRKIWQAMLGLLLICFVIWAAWFFTSSGFREFVRGRLEARVEQVTGGKTEIRAFRWNLSRMEFEAEDVTVHGTEPSSEKPFAHVDRLFAHVKILSFLQRK